MRAAADPTDVDVAAGPPAASGRAVECEADWKGRLTRPRSDSGSATCTPGRPSLPDPSSGHTPRDGIKPHRRVGGRRTPGKSFWLQATGSTECLVELPLSPSHPRRLQGRHLLHVANEARGVRRVHREVHGGVPQKRGAPHAEVHNGAARAGGRPQAAVDKVEGGVGACT